MGGPGLGASDARCGDSRSPAHASWRSDELVLVDARPGSVALQLQPDRPGPRTAGSATRTTARPGSPARRPCASRAARPPRSPTSTSPTTTPATPTTSSSTRFGRDSLDGAGLPLRLDGALCRLGGLPVRQRVLERRRRWSTGRAPRPPTTSSGHELTHGVTQSPSDLFYYYQSGAINESLSDVFGELDRPDQRRAATTRRERWQIGEDLPGRRDPRHGGPDARSATRIG